MEPVLLTLEVAKSSPEKRNEFQHSYMATFENIEFVCMFLSEFQNVLYSFLILFVRVGLFSL